MEKIQVESRLVDAAFESGKKLVKVNQGYAALTWVNHIDGTPYSLPLLAGKVKTIEIITYAVGDVSVIEGPDLSWDLPEYNPTKNVGGWFVDTLRAEFVRCTECEDYGNGPGRAVADVTRRVKALR